MKVGGGGGGGGIPGCPPPFVMVPSISMPLVASSDTLSGEWFRTRQRQVPRLSIDGRLVCMWLVRKRMS